MKRSRSFYQNISAVILYSSVRLTFIEITLTLPKQFVGEHADEEDLALGAALAAAAAATGGLGSSLKVSDNKAALF